MNYMIQIAFLPNVLNYPKVAELIAVLNARSIFWYIEMTGYGFLGCATWSAGYLFENRGKQKVIRLLCIWNGLISIAGSVLTFVFKGWVLTVPGLICYLLWNILVMIMMLYIIREYRFGRMNARVESLP